MVRQAEHALRIYLVNFLQRTDEHRKPANTVVDERGHTSPLAALEQLRQRLRLHLRPSAIKGAIRMLECPRQSPPGVGNILATGNGEFVNLSTVTT